MLHQVDPRRAGQSGTPASSGGGGGTRWERAAMGSQQMGAGRESSGSARNSP
jgi:hypothetical protein